MELNLDWKGFQRVFYPQRRTGGMREADSSQPAYLVVDGDRVLSGFAESEDLSDLRGGSLRVLASETAHRDLVVFDRASVDLWFQDILKSPHYYGQIESLRKLAKPSGVFKAKGRKTGDEPFLEVPGRDFELRVNRHFLLEALHGWWAKVLPSAYALYLRIEFSPGMPHRDFIAVMRRGQFEVLASPDLSSLSFERRSDPEQVVKYLSEKYLVPVQGLWIDAEKWYAWSALQDPWKQIAQALRANQIKLYPFRWSMAFLISTKGFLGI